MAQNNSYSLHKRRYAQISIKKRIALVHLVIDQGRTLSEAGRKLHINPSTVRLIIKKYKETGTYFMKKLRNTPRQHDKESVQDQSLEKGVKIQQGEMEDDEDKDQRAIVKEQSPSKHYIHLTEEQKWYYPFIQYPFQP